MKLEDIAIVSNNIRFRDSFSVSRLATERLISPGDIAIFEVLSNDGGYITQLELDGSEVRLAKGNKIIGVFGIRQSGTNISGDIPYDGLSVSEGDIFQILSSSTIVGNSRRVPVHIGQNPVDLRLEAIVMNNEGSANNLQDLTPYTPTNHYPGGTPIVLALGSSAECGKTTTTSELIKGFVKNGLRVAACKTNGSGNIRDKYSMRDAGANFYLDYVDFGMVTTYAVPPTDYLKVLKGLLNEAEKSNPDVLLLECGGDVMWGNIPALFADQEINRNFVAGVMCSTDYMAAYGAFRYTREQGVDVPIFFDVPIGKETFYRKQYFESMVGSNVYDVMDQTEKTLLISKVLDLMKGDK
jgi:hypothetical protein